MTKYLKLLLRPFSVLYGGIMIMRNYFYDKEYLSVHRFQIPVIAIGNLTVGGTGKTPHVEYLLRLLQKYKVATLSRGYKRMSKGFILADAESTAEQIGDEPYQYLKDFPGVKVAVSEKRVAGIEQLQELEPETEVVVLDDAMQHRAVEPSLNIMLTDYHRLFYQDHVLPAGLLREPKAGASRADIIVVTKCPQHLTKSEMEHVEGKVGKFAGPGKPVFFSTIKYGRPLAVGCASDVHKKIVLLAGIANPKPLREYLQQHFEVVQQFTFPDHHQYTEGDILKVMELVNQYKGQEISVITTRKDAVKLMDEPLRTLTVQLPAFYLPIEVAFLQNDTVFDKIILAHVKSIVEQKHLNQRQ